jgi:aspartate oxidase
MSLSQHSRPTVLLLCLSGSTISKNQLVALRTRIEPAATIQVVDNADAAISALSCKPSAVVVLDNAISEPTFECARPEILRYAQNGGRLITDPTQTNVTVAPSAHYEMAYANERHVEYKMHDRMSDLRADHLVS